MQHRLIQKNKTKFFKNPIKERKNIMALTNFISTVWTENLLSSLDKQYIAAAHCNREYEGDITEQGASVKIC